MYMHPDRRAYVNQYWVGESDAIAEGMILKDYEEGSGIWDDYGHIETEYFTDNLRGGDKEKTKEDLIEHILLMNKDKGNKLKQMLIAPNLWKLVGAELIEISNQQYAEKIIPQVLEIIDNTPDKYKAMRKISSLIGDCWED